MNQLLNTVLGIFPRWLIFTAGVVAVTFIAWGAYNGAMMIYAQRRLAEVELTTKTIDLPTIALPGYSGSQQTTSGTPGPNAAVPRAPTSATQRREPKSW